jgi:hypothetical protein
MPQFFDDAGVIPKKMDVYIVSKVLSYTPYILRNTVHMAIGMYIPPEDRAILFDVDLVTIPANHLDDYLLSLGTVSSERFERIVEVARRDKIFITKKTMKSLGGGGYKKHYRKMTYLLKKGTDEWIRNNPFPWEVRGWISIGKRGVVPLCYMPYLFSSSVASRYHRGVDVIKSYISANVIIDEIPQDPDVDDDEIFSLYCECVRRGILSMVFSVDLAKRLIRETGMLLRTEDIDYCEMYILTYSEDGTIDGASDELISRAYRMARRRR